MFEVDDVFLVNVGYDIDSLSDEEKDNLKSRFTNIISQRVLLRLAGELDNEQANEFSDIQEDPERALRWLNEFHADFQTRADYQQVLRNLGSEPEANILYAGILWMGYAVPAFGQIIQEELNAYQADLISKRQAASELLAEIDDDDE